MTPSALVLLASLVGCLPSPPDRPVDDDDAATVDDDDSTPNDDDSQLDDDDTDDDDFVGTDDDDVGTGLGQLQGPGGLCAAPGRSANASYAAVQCTGPVLVAVGVSSSSLYTVVAGASTLLQLQE